MTDRFTNPRIPAILYWMVQLDLPLSGRYG
jgi:hypothetical protein